MRFTAVRLACMVPARSALVGFAVLALCYGVPAHGGFVPLDVCTHADVVGVVRVQSTEATAVVTEAGGTDIATRAIVEFERVVRGPPLESLSLWFDGGEVEHAGSTSSIATVPTVGERLLVYLKAPAAEGRPWFRPRPHDAVDPDMNLPDERLLSSIWEEACRAAPEGIPPVGPAEPWSRNWVEVLNIAGGPGAYSGPAISPEAQRVLGFVECHSTAVVVAAGGPDVGLCLGGTRTRSNARADAVPERLLVDSTSTGGRP